ncbi:MAG: ComF family protein [Verrucomicrobia bacterium]|nr:ComF family protein [Verrucomicrobiota bacterium]
MSRFADAALHFLYPELCQLCRERRATPAEGYVCAECWQGMRFVTEPFCERCGLPFEGALTTKFECANCREMELRFGSARAAVFARGPALEVIHRFKYNQALWFEPFLADLLRRVADPAGRTEPFDLLVPVPLHPLKLREREFNQAEHLARRLGRMLGVPLDAQLLERLKPTQTQTKLSRQERADNVRHAFATCAGRRLAGERVALIDDVLTTGATASACAHALLKAGAGSVRVFTVARAVGAVS